MESKNNSRVDETTIDNIISELEQMEKMLGKKPFVTVTGEFSEPVRSALEGRGYNCSEEGEYSLSTDAQDLDRYREKPTDHLPHRPEQQMRTY